MIFLLSAALPSYSYVLEGREGRNARTHLWCLFLCSVRHALSYIQVVASVETRLREFFTWSVLLKGSRKWIHATYCPPFSLTLCVPVQRCRLGVFGEEISYWDRVLVLCLRSPVTSHLLPSMMVKWWTSQSIGKWRVWWQMRQWFWWFTFTSSCNSCKTDQMLIYFTSVLILQHSLNQTSRE